MKNSRQLGWAAKWIFGITAFLCISSSLMAQNGPSCSTLCFGPGGSKDVSSAITITTNTYYSSLKVKSGGVLTIKSPAKLYVGALGTGASSQVVDFQNGSKVIVESGASIVVNGLLNNSNNSDMITVHGSVVVTGNVTLGSGSAMTGSGSISATGSMTGAGAAFGSPVSCSTGPCNSCTPIANTISSNQNYCASSATSAIIGTAVSGGTYQWAKSTTSSTIGFVNITNATAKDYSPGTVSTTTYFIRYVKSGTCSYVSNVVAIKIGSSALSITSQPSAASTCVGSSATFSVLASGPGISYKWQQDPGTGVFADIASGTIFSGATSNTLNIANATGLNGYKYRAIISSTCGIPLSVTSSSATLTVNAPSSAAISYTGSPYCATLSASQPATVTGTSGGTFTSSPAGLSINASTGAFTPNTSAVGIYKVVYTMAASTGCAPQTATTSVKISAGGEWTGATNANWSTSSNWVCGIVPTSVTDITISSTSNNPIISTQVSARNLTIENGATLSASSAATLKVFGDWTNNGTFSPGKSTVEFNGVQDQTITNGVALTERFYNLTVNKLSGKVTIGPSTNMEILANGTLKLTHGTFDANNRSVTLKSAAPTNGKDSTARLATVENTASLLNASKFTVERYIPLHNQYKLGAGSLVSYRLTFLAPAVSKIVATDFADDIMLTGGPAGTGFQAPNSTRTSSLSYYCETAVTSAGREGGWKYVMAKATTMEAGNGYKVICGYDGNADLLKVTGTPVVGNFTKSITYTVTGTQGWNLLGNPYACEIDFEAFYEANKDKIEPALYILDPVNNSESSPNSSYYTYFPSTGIAIDPRASARPSTSGRYIPSSQAFFVKARPGIGSGATVVFTESMKASGSVSVYGNFRKENIDLVRLNLSNGKLTDQAVVYFNDAATNGYDSDLDAAKIETPTLGIYTGNTPVSINCVPNEHGKMMVPITLTTHAAGNYNLSVEQYDNAGGENLYIFDKLHHKYLTLGEGMAHVLDLPAGTNHDRFFLTNARTSVATGLEEGTEHHEHHGFYPNPYHRGTLHLNLDNTFQGDATIDVLDGSGTVIKTFQSSGVHHGKKARFDLTHTLEDLTPGSYVVRVSNGTEFDQEKLLIVR